MTVAIDVAAGERHGVWRSDVTKACAVLEGYRTVVQQQRHRAVHLIQDREVRGSVFVKVGCDQTDGAVARRDRSARPEFALAIPQQDRYGIVVAIGSGEIRDTVGVEVRDGQGGRMCPGGGVSRRGERTVTMIQQHGHASVGGGYGDIAIAVAVQILYEDRGGIMNRRQLHWGTECASFAADQAETVSGGQDDRQGAGSIEV